MRFWNIPTLIVFWLLLTIFLGRFFMLNQAIYGDGIYYWSYLRSIVVDYDVDLKNEASHHFSPDGNNSITEPSPSEKSLVENKYYPLGPSLMWSPAYVLAHILSKPLSLPQNGYADHYQIAVGVLNVSYIVIGLVLMYKLLLTRFNGFTAFLTTILILFATNLVYYGSLDILNSHPPSFFTASVLLTLLFKLKQKVTGKRILFSGICVGLLALIRPQDLLFGILFIPFLIENKRFSALFLLGGFISYLPQIILSFVLFGTIFTLPYMTGSGTFFPIQPHLLELFFLPSQGLLFYSPIYIVGFFGIFLYVKKGGIFAKRFLFLILLELLLISIWSGWSQGEAFGLRMVISLLPIVAFGIAEVITYLSKKLSKSAIISICILFIFQNFLMILAFHLLLHESTYINGQLSTGGEIRQEILQKINEFN